MSTAAQILVEARREFEANGRLHSVDIHGVRYEWFEPALGILNAEAKAGALIAYMALTCSYACYWLDILEVGNNKRPHLDAFGRAIEACLGEGK